MTTTKKPSRLFLKKSVERVRAEAGAQPFRRVLGAADLVMLGIGCIIGAGIFVLTGNAAASFAGPAVLISFLIAGVACALTGLCYAELASTLPVTGSAYTYSYTTLGEVVAWITGWLMVLELGIAVSLVAVGFSGYTVSLLRDFGIAVPPEFATAYINSVSTPDGLRFVAGQGFNLVAVLGVFVASILLIIGIETSVAVTRFVVLTKIVVLLAFAVIGSQYIESVNWTPFIPEHEGGFSYGWPGIFRAASVIFFAYVGFETVCTAAAEARNPQRDLPIGIIGSLIVCTVIYMAVAAVLTGVVPYRLLGVADPMAVAVDVMKLPWFGLVVKLGAIAGLFSVMLATTYGQTRVFYAMSRDGLLPALFSRVHAKRRTPHIGTLVLGVAIALAAGLLPITILSDMVTLGTALGFGIVCISVIWLRNVRPDLERPFRVPGGGFQVNGVKIAFIPALGILFCILMVAPLLLDIVEKALRGDAIPAMLLGGYCALGAVIYWGYGLRHSKLAAADVPPETQGLSQESV
ncbi:amino acid permease [Peristeroidobacter soli]|jgi:APA family basic amino acid/polyamine antiporter|uniref:amino acid permease n=1 Tax=Peristeroidobacter soli TaxID=2497877 RepID=UPI00101D71E9|nr:amino acid permease [Peristeroidobacter soli]